MGRLLKKKDKAKKKKQVEDSEKKSEIQGNPGVSKGGSETGSAGVIGSIGQKVSTQKKTPVAKAVAGKQGLNTVEKSLQFLREVKVELKKVTWPSRKQTIGSTVVVIVLVMIISFFLGAVDVGLSSLVKVVLQ